MRTVRRRILEGVLLAAGCWGAGMAVWSVVRQQIYQAWNDRAFDQQSEENSPAADGHIRDRIDGDKSIEHRKNHPVPFTEDAALMGRLTIPRIGLRTMVREGADEDTLSIALGHITGTPVPGEGGNTGIAGHRDSLFRGLRNVKTNDRIVFENVEGETFEYVVGEILIVEPTNVSVLRASENPELTLVTCYPFNFIGPAPKRYVVQARQVSQTYRPGAVTKMFQRSGY